MMPRRVVEVSLVVAAMGVASSFVVLTGESEPAWTVTDAQKAEKNTVAPTAESVARGGDLYKKNCLACHGATGDGKGPVTARLGFSAGDLTRGAEMARKTDGELFWKIAMGRGSMPAFRTQKRLTDPQIWDVVNYIRTLARK